MKIQHLRHNEIDRMRWDATIAQSLCDLPYAYSWYLDVVCPMWEALVTEDYAYVMPLPLKKKSFVSYLIHPIWVQQLGVYSAQEITEKVFKAFYCRIPYLMFDFNINYLNYSVARGNVKRKNNLIVPHSENIYTIRKNYNYNTKRNISKAQNLGLRIDEIGVEEFVELWKSENGAMRQDLHATIQPLVESVISNFSEQCTPYIFGVSNGCQLIAALFGIRTRERFIYLIPVSNKEGKEKSAMFMLVDYILENICCKNGLTFDCEGSMIEGVARFYRGFGAIEQPYASISRCRPQWLVELLHR